LSGVFNSGSSDRIRTGIERGLGEYTIHEKWLDSRGIMRVKHSGYVGPSYKSLRSFGAELAGKKS